MRHPFISMLSLFSALTFWQAPEFMQQYFQRLGGAAEELDGIVQRFNDDSRRSGYERSTALGIMAKNPERLVRDQATRMEQNIARLNRLRQQQGAMRDKGSFACFSAFVTNFDWPLVERTRESYALALPLTFEGVAFAVLGFFAAYFPLIGVTVLFRRRLSGEVEA
jgi:Protein of unknown function (DUF2937)